MTHMRVGLTIYYWEVHMRLIKEKLEAKDYHKVLDIWKRSVLATHDFLAEKDRKELETEIPTYLNYVNAYLWYKENELVGFSGTNDENLEMLFLDPQYFNKGHGTEILQYLINEENIRYVDVNKDNASAMQFYLKNGFEKYSESPQDGQGRNYPICHLQLK